MANIVKGIGAIGASIVSLTCASAIGSKIEKNADTATIKKVVGKAMQIFPSFLCAFCMPGYGPVFSACFVIALIPSIIKFLSKSESKVLDIADKVLMLAAKTTVYLFSLSVLRIIGKGIIESLLDGELGFTVIATFLFNCFALPLIIDFVNTYKNYFVQSKKTNVLFIPT